MTSHCEVGHGGGTFVLGCYGSYKIKVHRSLPFPPPPPGPERGGEVREREKYYRHIQYMLPFNPPLPIDSIPLSMWSPPEHEVLLPASLTPSIVVPYGNSPGGGLCHRDSPPVATSTEHQNHVEGGRLSAILYERMHPRCGCKLC